MEKPYGSEWPKEEKVKCREMVAPEAHYKIVAPWLDLYNIALFLEEEIPVLYVYELLLQPRVPGKGLGRFLMQLVELMAQKIAEALPVRWTILKATPIKDELCPTKMNHARSL
ncbi:hypothetical protein JHK85_018582 [Glycine max]|nr:hypothetical protein JHK85_018582 [Glycine max]